MSYPLSELSNEMNRSIGCAGAKSCNWHMTICSCISEAGRPETDQSASFWILNQSMC